MVKVLVHFAKKCDSTSNTAITQDTVLGRNPVVCKQTETGSYRHIHGKGLDPDVHREFKVLFYRDKKESGDEGHRTPGAPQQRLGDHREVFFCEVFLNW